MLRTVGRLLRVSERHGYRPVVKGAGGRDSKQCRRGMSEWRIVWATWRWISAIQLCKLSAEHSRGNGPNPRGFALLDAQCLIWELRAIRKIVLVRYSIADGGYPNWSSDVLR